MSWRTTLALLLFTILISFVRGYLALGQAGVVWYYQLDEPLPAPKPARVEKASSERQVPIDLNRATKSELVGLPGIGPVLADRIIEYRASKGGFRKKEELQKINGIGPIKFQELEPRITVANDQQ